MKHTLVAWMRDKPGVLNRVSGMLRRRNFNIDSLQVGHSETPGISRMTFVVDGNEHMVDQVINQMRKVVDVTRVEDITHRPIVVRELALIRVQATPETRSEIVQMVNIYRGEIVDVAHGQHGRTDRRRGRSRRLADRSADALRHRRDGAHRSRGAGARQRTSQTASSHCRLACELNGSDDVEEELWSGA